MHTTHAHTQICTCICACAYIHTRALTHVHTTHAMHVCIIYACAHTHSNICIHFNTQTYTHAHNKHTHVPVHAHITCTHTHTHTIVYSSRLHLKAEGVIILHDTEEGNGASGTACELLKAGEAGVAKGPGMGQTPCYPALGWTAAPTPRASGSWGPRSCLPWLCSGEEGWSRVQRPGCHPCGAELDLQSPAGCSEGYTHGGGWGKKALRGPRTPP